MWKLQRKPAEQRRNKICKKYGRTERFYASATMIQFACPGQAGAAA